MSVYSRPDVVAQCYRDADGATIEYGDRWDDDGPPEASYSITSHLERFEPLHQVADALIEHLRSAYDVEVAGDPDRVLDLTDQPQGVTRAVRVTPNAANAASLTFEFTDFPGVIVYAGSAQAFCHPVCGCDACDESWDSVADDLEFQVLAVVSGGFREEIRGTPEEPMMWCRLEAPDATRVQTGGYPAGAEASARTHAAATQMAPPADGWAPWPSRDAGKTRS